MPQKARKKMQSNVEITIKTEQAEQTLVGKCLVGTMINDCEKDGRRNTHSLLVGIASHGEILQGIAASSVQVIKALAGGDPNLEKILFAFLKEEMQTMFNPGGYEILEEIDLSKGVRHE